MNSHIYISKSVEIYEDKFEDAKEFLVKENLDYKYWTGVQYTPNFVDQNIRNCSALVLLIGDNNSDGRVGRGCYNEIKVAQESNIPTFIMYRRKKDNIYQFYLLNSVQTINLEDWRSYAKVNFGGNTTSYFIDKYSTKVSKKTIQEKLSIESESILLNNIDLLLLV